MYDYETDFMFFEARLMGCECVKNGRTWLLMFIWTKSK